MTVATQQPTQNVSPAGGALDFPKAPPPSGLWLVLAVVLAQIEAINAYTSKGLSPRAAQESRLNLNKTEAWVGALRYIIGQIDDIIRSQGKFHGDSNTNDGSTTKSYKIQTAMAEFNIRQNLMQQSSTFYGDLAQNSQQSLSDVSQIIQVLLQMYAQGPQNQLDTIRMVV